MYTQSWKFYNLAQEHNRLMGDSNPALLYPAPELSVLNASSPQSFPEMTKSVSQLSCLHAQWAIDPLHNAHCAPTKIMYTTHM